MKHKRIKLDWEQIEDAFNNLNDELVYYLDLVTGHVHLEGEGDDQDDDETNYSHGAASASPASDATRAYIEPPDTAVKIEWIQQFMKDEADLDPELVAKVTAGLTADDPAEAIRTALNQHPDDRDRWYLYRSERIRRFIERWLKSHNIATDTPTWKNS